MFQELKLSDDQARILCVALGFRVNELKELLAEESLWKPEELEKWKGDLAQNEEVLDLLCKCGAVTLSPLEMPGKGGNQ